MLRKEELPGFDEECVLVKGISLESMPGLTESAVLYIQPCASVQGRVNCELRFGIPRRGAEESFFDFPALSRILNAYSDRFAETRVSSSLGVARVQWRGKKILIFKNGRIVIREAIDEEDAKATIDFLSKLLAPSIICDKCGQVLLNCAAASCRECAVEHASLSSLPSNLLWVGGLQRIRDLVKALIERSSFVKDVKREESITSVEYLSTQSDRIVHLILDLIAYSGNREELAVGILLLKRAWDLGLTLEVLDRIQRYKSKSN